MKQDTNYGIALPEIKMLKGGKSVTAEEALKITTRPGVATYEWNGLELAILLNPRAVKSADEDKVQEIQLRLGEISGLDLDALGQSGDEEGAAKASKSIMSGGASKLSEMSKAMRELRVAQAAMLAPAVLACNDPAEENYPSLNSLKEGGKLARIQLDAMLEWWNPTEAPSTAETKTTETP